MCHVAAVTDVPMQVIVIVGGVCGVIVVVLLIVLVILLCKRRDLQRKLNDSSRDVDTHTHTNN